MNVPEPFIEVIRCPRCHSKQRATVEPTPYWNIYIHDCRECGYMIMESEWNRIVPWYQTIRNRLRWKFGCWIQRLRDRLRPHDKDVPF